MARGKRMGKRLVLVGGGHAHMVTLGNLGRIIKKGHEVVVIGPSDFHYYSGMGPGMLGRIYTPEEIRFATRHVVEKQGGRFVKGRAVSVNPHERSIRLESGDGIAYDIVSFNAGSGISETCAASETKNVFPVKPIERLLDAQSRILEHIAEKRITIGIVGGGPAAAEIAGNVWRLAKDHGKIMPKICVFAGTKFLAKFPDNVVKPVSDSLKKRKIEILEQGYVKEIRSGQIVLESGESHASDITFLATGVKPSPIFVRSGLPVGSDGGLRVNEYLQSDAHPEIFGGGDCICFQDMPLDKVGVFAVRQNPVLWHNLMAALDGGELKPFDPGGDYLLILNLGDGTGVLRKRGIVSKGKFAFLLKNYIDKRFMKKFQAIE